jgi:large subunit ribosomal protein L10
VLALRGAVLDGRALGEDGVKRLATLPPKEQLQATVVGTIAAPLTGLVSLLAAAPRELVVVIDQIIQVKQEQEAA